MPARLAADLARHHSPGGTRLLVSGVGQASISFAEWLTYDVVALRTGDPFAALVEKAEGGEAGGLAASPVFGVLEFEVRVGEKDARARVRSARRRPSAYCWSICRSRQMLTHP